MFGFKKNVDSNIYVPADGRLTALEDVSDQIFASKVPGDGVTTEVTGEEIYVPYDGRLVVLADTEYASGILVDNGVEVLVHIGLDTVELNSMGPAASKAVNNRVKKGIPIIRLGREFFQSQSVCFITPVLISNGVGCPLTSETTGKEVAAGENAATCSQQKRGRVIQAIEKINNNAAICLDNNNHELIAFGRGTGFPPTPYELNDISKIDRTYYGVNSSYLGLISEIPENTFEVPARIVDMAVNYIDCESSSNLVSTLADHINFVAEGNRANMDSKNSFLYNIQHFYEKEMDIGNPALRMIRRYLKVNLPEEEAGNIAPHFINAEALNEKDKELNFSGTIIEEVTHLIEKELDIHIKQEDSNYSRFVSHLQYLIKRKNTAGNVPSDNIKLCTEMKQESPQIYQCVLKVRDYMAKKPERELNEEEQLHLILHVNRFYAREDCNR